MKIGFYFLLLFVLSCSRHDSNPSFQIAIEPLQINGLPGLQSFAYGEYDGKWLIFGGRTDGLHRRQPWATFAAEGENNKLMVVDPVNRQTWSVPVSSLPTSIQEQLISTNMEFHQEGDYLYVIGGYGYSKSADDHVTYPYMTAVKLPEVIKAIIERDSFNSFFRQIKDEQFAVTGGYLNKIYDAYYLTGGQRFDGRYNPMGHPSYIQTYTNSVRKFKLVDNGIELKVIHLPGLTDSTNLHRRDYNVIPQIYPNGQEGLTAFSGVFQVDVDLPFMNCINIDSSGYHVNNDFSQFYNQYHCAHIPLYSARTKEMHNLFFGGIAQYSDSAGVLVQDNNVPFVKTISRITRERNGKMAEFKLPVEMPSYQGSGSEFIPVGNLSRYSNEVIRLDDLNGDSTLIGYIFGGINSPEANIFWQNDGSQSTASNHVFKVFLLKSSTLGSHQLNAQSVGNLHLQVFPDPAKKEFIITFNLKDTREIKLSITDRNGRSLKQSELKNLSLGVNKMSVYIEELTNMEVYYITLQTSTENAMQKIIVEI